MMITKGMTTAAIIFPVFDFLGSGGFTIGSVSISQGFLQILYASAYSKESEE